MAVEGYDDLFSVVGLMRAHIPWPDDPRSAPVHIRIGFGAEGILKRGFLDGLLKSNVVKTLGVMLDADTIPLGRYQSIRALCQPFFPALPAILPEDGLVIENDDHKRLGVWIMPDNHSEGNLETFLRFLVPSKLQAVWKHAVESTEIAKKVGCEYRDSHIEKANLYTWLAWQDPPGQSPGECLTRKILDPNATSAAAFVTWFKKLYQL
jgi:hypothetical protein